MGEGQAQDVMIAYCMKLRSVMSDVSSQVKACIPNASHCRKFKVNPFKEDTQQTPHTLKLTDYVVVIISRALSDCQ